MNILIYVFDGLRADHLSCYGYGRETTPTVDALARDGILFERAYAQATWTRASVGTLLTGLYPAVHGANEILTGLHPEVPRLPQVLQKENYRTAVFSAIAQISPSGGFDIGVDHFADLHRDNALANPDTFTSEAGSLPDVSRLPRSDSLTKLGGEWLSQGSEPFFALIWSIDTHVPYLLPEDGGRFAAPAQPGQLTGSIRGLREARNRADTRRMIDLYDSLIYSNDQNFGQLLSRLKASGLYDDTLIVVMGDHGEIFNEYGRLSHARAARWLKPGQHVPGLRKLIKRFRLLNPYGLLGHVDVLPYEEVLHIPLIVKLPHQERAGSRVVQEGGIIDITPTIYDLTGLQPEGWSSDSLQGVSLAPLLRNGSDSLPFLSKQGHSADLGRASDGTPSRSLFSDSCMGPDSTRYLSVQDEHWKLIRLIYPRHTTQTWWQYPAQAVYGWLERSSGRELLFRRGEEGKDVGREFPEVKRRLTQALDDWLAECDRLGQRLSVAGLEVDEEVVERLRDLGYLS